MHRPNDRFRTMAMMVLHRRSLLGGHQLQRFHVRTTGNMLHPNMLREAVRISVMVKVALRLSDRATTAETTCILEQTALSGPHQNMIEEQVEQEQERKHEHGHEEPSIMIMQGGDDTPGTTGLTGRTGFNVAEQRVQRPGARA